MLASSKGLIGNFNSKATELYVTSMGLQLDFHGGFDKVILEMNSQSITHLLQDSVVDFSVKGALLEEVKSFVHFFQFSYMYICIS